MKNTCMCEYVRIVQGVKVDNMIGTRMEKVYDSSSDKIQVYKCSRCNAYWYRMIVEDKKNGTSFPIMKQICDVKYAPEFSTG